MTTINPIPIIDLFAGPGGLGEGFSSLKNGKAFKIGASIEMNPHAHQTLQLRAFYRLLKTEAPEQMTSYYNYCNGLSDQPWDSSNKNLWDESNKEAILGELGKPEDNQRLENSIKKLGLSNKTPWVLIGGPPCQAYSLVGRARNQGISGYIAENDHRHFLYKEYLSVIQKFSPAVFVMENVKGILSAKIAGKYIFHSILKDLACPTGNGGDHKYRIHSLSCNTFYEFGMKLESIDPNDYVIKAEKYGIPQARHRVILVGIREDFKTNPEILQNIAVTNLSDAISSLPPLRSSISCRGQQNTSSHEDEWHSTLVGNINRLRNEINLRSDLEDIGITLKNLDYTNAPESSGANKVHISKSTKASKNPELNIWYSDANLKVVLNHEARSHMRSDLLRYLYASAFTRTRGKSPKGHTEFDLGGLAPDHKNWKSGKFSDRFRVQHELKPATTITSHISKDGHYFIHPDPIQCRSLTVREAARIQTFPDNYLFQGNRTQQYHQVGNAVPPLLAHKIAAIVYETLKETTFRR